MRWKANFKRPARQEKPSPSGKWRAKIETGKRRLAGWLQGQSERLSVRTKKILLVICCLVFGSLMLLQVISGLGNNRLPEGGKITKPIVPLPLPALPADSMDRGITKKHLQTDPNNNQKREQ